MRRQFALLLVTLTIVCGAWAQNNVTFRKVDLQASDGTPLKAVYFPAAKSGPGILLFIKAIVIANLG